LKPLASRFFRVSQELGGGVTGLRSDPSFDPNGDSTGWTVQGWEDGVVRLSVILLQQIFIPITLILSRTRCGEENRAPRYPW